MNPLARTKEIGPGMWVLAVATVGLVFLVWHAYASDDDDQDWTSPKEMQAPVNAPVVLGTEFPGTHSVGQQMATSTGFRSRSYPATLADASFSIIGEV